MRETLLVLFATKEAANAKTIDFINIAGSNANAGIPLCIRTIRLRQQQGEGQQGTLCQGNEIFHCNCHDGIPVCSVLHGYT